MIWWTHWPKQELYKAGRYAEAVPKAQRVLEIREKMLGPDHPNIATLPGAVGSSPRWKAGRSGSELGSSSVNAIASVSLRSAGSRALAAAHPLAAIRGATAERQQRVVKRILVLQP